MRTLRSFPLFLAIVALATLFVAPSAQAVDPFYEGLLQDGVEALDRGDAETAVHRLQIATFGMLEEPPRLAEGLAHLALAHVALGDEAAFRDVFYRILDIEKQFGAYSEAEIPADTRAELGNQALRLLPSRVLEGTSFENLLESREQVRIASLPPRQRRTALEKEAESDPGNPVWPTALAKLEIELGRDKEALEWADKAAALGTDLPCARLAAHAGLREDEEAVAEVSACETATDELLLVRAALGSYTRLERWQEAAGFLDQVPEEFLADNALSRLVRRIERNLPQDEMQRTESETEMAGQADEANADEEMPEDAASSLSASEMNDLQAAREILRKARRTEELREAAALVEPIAEKHPDHEESQQLAGEIAYRAARWQEAADYFRRSGDPGEERPALLFYMAVAFYESGDREAAEAALARCLPSLHRTPYVDRYIEKILGES